MKKLKVEPILKDTLLAFVKNSVGSRSWKNAYAYVNGKRKDIINNGDLSCSFFTTSILTFFKLVKEIHMTTRSTEKDLIRSGWRKVKTPKEGDIIVWEDNHAGIPHIGFYIGNDFAVSPSSKKKMIAKHHFTYREKRGITAIYRHPKIIT